MKKIAVLFFALALGSLAFATYTGTSSSDPKAADVYIPIGNNTQISLMELSTMKVKDYQQLTGKHLNLFQKLGFKMSQRKLRKAISSDGTVNNKKLSSLMASGDFTEGFNGGWFVLGILTGLIGVLLSYIIPGDEDVKRNRQKWAWLGLGVVVVIVLLALIL